MLATQEFGSGGVPLIIAHGLFGSGRNWGVIAKRLADDRRVITVDMRNHAGSFWDGDHSYAALANDLKTVAHPLGQVDLLGHSMGGKAAMVAALNGVAIRRLIVADIAPVTYSHTQLHLIEAMRALNLSAVATRTEADGALASSVPDATTRAFLLQSLDIRTKSWRLNLDVLAARMDEIIGFPTLDAQVQTPTLFLAGAQSDYITPEARPEIKRLFPKAIFAKIPGAGHWLHAEKPREFEQAVRVFLSQ